MATNKARSITKAEARQLRKMASALGLLNPDGTRLADSNALAERIQLLEKRFGTNLKSSK